MPSKIPVSLFKPDHMIPLSAPTLSPSAWTYVKECLDSGWVSSAGPVVKRFEESVAQFVGAPFAVALSSGTAALHLGLKAVGVQPGDLVLVSNLTFAASVHAIRHCGADPIFVDAEASTWQMDVKKLRTYVQESCQVKNNQCVHTASGRVVRALVPVHIMGLACDMDSLIPLAKEFSLAVVEDAAEAMGVTYKGQAVGTFGDVGVYSFNGNKIITAGGGGLVVTPDAERAEKIRYWSTQAKDDAVESYHKEVGYNYRMTSLQAALGLSQLDDLPRYVEIKNKIAETYATSFKKEKDLVLMPTPDHVAATYWLYTVLLPSSITVDQRKDFISYLAAQKIQARPFWVPLHDLPPYKDCDATDVSVSQELYRRGVSLPSSVGLSSDQLDYCIRTFKDGCATRLG